MFVYALLHPETLEIAYVGQSVAPRKRYLQHICEAKKGNHCYVYRWMKKQIDNKLHIPMIILQSDHLIIKKTQTSKIGSKILSDLAIKKNKK